MGKGRKKEVEKEKEKEVEEEKEEEITDELGRVVPPLEMVTRVQWGAASPGFPGLQPLERPAMSVLLRYYTGPDVCHTAEECIPCVRDIQKRHQHQHLVDIAHNFLVGPDGTIFEGRGWTQSESPDFEMKKLNHEYKKARVTQESNINLAYIGNYDGEGKVTDEMKKSIQDIIDYGVKCKQIVEKYKFMYVHEVL